MPKQTDNEGYILTTENGKPAWTDIKNVLQINTKFINEDTTWFVSTNTGYDYLTLKEA